MEIFVWKNDFCNTVVIYEISVISAWSVKVLLIFASRHITQCNNSIHIHVNCLNFLSDDVNPDEHHHF